MKCMIHRMIVWERGIIRDWRIVCRDFVTYCHDERVAHAGSRISKLISKLNVMVVKPPATDNGSIGTGYACLCEETGKQVSNDSTNSMRRKHLMGKNKSVMCTKHVYGVLGKLILTSRVSS